LSAFLQATAVTRVGGRYAAAIDPEWFIWGPFGGYLAALALRAMGAHSVQRRPATFSCQYLNVGEAGPVEIEVTSRRSSRRAECLNARILQNGKQLIDAQAWLVAEKLSGLDHRHARMPQIAAATELPRWDGFKDREALSRIWTHIERRPKLDARESGSSPGKPEWTCWLKLSQPIPANDPLLQAARAVLWIDLAPWNAVLMAHGSPTTHISPTLDLTVQFQSSLYALDAAASDWLLVDTASPSAGAGLIGANATLWSQAGELVAVGTAQALCIPNLQYAALLSVDENARAAP
jgi:acyl-CoA thioesterase